jgi:hypothetical protein
MEPEDELLTQPMEETPEDYDELEPGGPPDSEGEAPDDDGHVFPPLEEQNYAVPFDPTTIDDQTLMAEVQRRQYLHQQTQQPYVDPPYARQYDVDPRLAQIVELSYTNPAMAEALRLQIAEERATQRVMEHIAPTINPIREREAIQNSGLNAHGQQYLSETFARLPGFDVGALMRDPVARDVLTRAARDYESERTKRSAPRYESAASEAPTLSAEDWRAIRDFEKMTGDRVDSDVVRSVKRGL